MEEDDDDDDEYGDDDMHEYVYFPSVHPILPACLQNIMNYRNQTGNGRKILQTSHVITYTKILPQRIFKFILIRHCRD